MFKKTRQSLQPKYQGELFYINDVTDSVSHVVPIEFVHVYLNVWNFAGDVKQRVEYWNKYFLLSQRVLVVSFALNKMRKMPLLYGFFAWWRHEMETFSALLAICVGNSPVTGEFPTQRPVTRSFDVFFDQLLNKRLSKQWWGWWFETPSRPVWHHWNVHVQPNSYQYNSDS